MKLYKIVVGRAMLYVEETFVLKKSVSSRTKWDGDKLLWLMCGVTELDEIGNDRI